MTTREECKVEGGLVNKIANILYERYKDLNSDMPAYKIYNLLKEHFLSQRKKEMEEIMAELKARMKQLKSNKKTRKTARYVETERLYNRLLSRHLEDGKN